MTKYLISFNDEWVSPHTPEQLHDKSVAGMAVIRDMEEAGVFVFGDGGLDASSVLCHVEARAGEPVFTDGPYAESKEHLGGLTVVEVPDDAPLLDRLVGLCGREPFWPHGTLEG